MRALLVGALLVAATALPTGAATRPVTVYPVGDSITYGSSGATTRSGVRAATSSRVTSG